MDTRCEYYKVTDARIHALRWDGQCNACEATDQWECSVCGSKHTARLGTPMHGLKTASKQVKLAVHLAMKGMNIADIGEVLDHSEETITRWLERLNLTIRHIIAALHRRTWSLAATIRGLRWRVVLSAAYYNFCRCHASLQQELPNGCKRRRTPAMALGITGHPWSVKEFITHPVY